MTQENLRVVDPDTGEIGGGVLVYVAHRAKIKEAWFMGFQAGFMQLAKDEALAGQPLRVLLALLAKLDFENFIALSQSELASDLGMGKNRVCEAIRRLRERGVVLDGPKVGASRTYRLNPGYAWRGTVKNLDTARRRHLRGPVVDLAKARAEIRARTPSRTKGGVT